MKQTIKLYQILVLINIIPAITIIWVNVEFIIYLVKDTDFNWWSVTSFVLSTIFGVGYYIHLLAKSKRASQAHVSKCLSEIKKSAFNERLDKIAKRRGIR